MDAMRVWYSIKNSILENKHFAISNFVVTMATPHYTNVWRIVMS